MTPAKVKTITAAVIARAHRTAARSLANPVDFHHIDVHFSYRGPDLATAEQLTETWKAR